MRASERSRLHFVEAQAKRYKWRSVALVGVCDTGLARQFLAHFPRCKVLVVPIWREDLRPGPAGAQRNFARNLRIWTKAYGGRFECEQASPLKVAELTERQFDGVVLWTGIEPDLLAVIGGAWVPRVVDGGWLLGVDHRVALTRSVLNQVAPGWVQYREGIWGVRVRRAVDEPAVDTGPDSAGVIGDVAHDPVDSGPDVDDAVHVAAPDKDGAEGEPGDDPMKPPVGEIIAPKRRGGRPKGSKNKPKVDAA